jgi:hypothetical protein
MTNNFCMYEQARNRDVTWIFSSLVDDLLLVCYQTKQSRLVVDDTAMTRQRCVHFPSTESSYKGHIVTRVSLVDIISCHVVPCLWIHRNMCCIPTEYPCCMYDASSNVLWIRCSHRFCIILILNKSYQVTAVIRFGRESERQGPRLLNSCHSRYLRKDLLITVDIDFWSECSTSTIVIAHRSRPIFRCNMMYFIPNYRH